LGFEVTEVVDASTFSMNRAADGFLRTAREADLGMYALD
jgi:hypothetical protein